MVNLNTFSHANHFLNNGNYTEKLFIPKYVLFYNDSSKKYKESRENRGVTVNIPSGLEIFRSQNTKDSENDMKL